MLGVGWGVLDYLTDRVICMRVLKYAFAWDSDGPEVTVHRSVCLTPCRCASGML